MPSREQYSHLYLQDLSDADLNRLNQCCQKWQLNDTVFADKISNWFNNFREQGDWPLALNVVTGLTYYSEADFLDLLRQRQDDVGRFLHDSQLDPARLFFAVPDDVADSATRHAHPLSKVWQLPNERFFPFSRIGQMSLGKADTLILFNNTYGSGKQFMRDVWPSVRPLLGQVGAVLIVGAVMAAPALDLFTRQANGAHIIPQYASKGVADSKRFTASEVARLKILGSRIHGKFPLGYGNCGLLLAYHFQCPNNSLPLIWADGKNNLHKGKAYPWTPLFAYLGKTDPEATAAPATPAQEASGPDHGAPFVPGGLKASAPPKSFDELADLLAQPDNWQQLHDGRWIGFFQRASRDKKWPDWEPDATGFHAFCTRLVPSGAQLLSCLLTVLSMGKSATLSVLPGSQVSSLLQAVCAVGIERWIQDAATVLPNPPDLAEGVRLTLNDDWIIYLVAVEKYQRKAKLSSDLASTVPPLIKPVAPLEGFQPADQLAPACEAIEACYTGKSPATPPTREYITLISDALRQERGDVILGVDHTDGKNPLQNPAVRRAALLELDAPTVIYGNTGPDGQAAQGFEDTLRRMIDTINQKLFPNNTTHPAAGKTL
jgi:hypothetical protein